MGWENKLHLCYDSSEKIQSDFQTTNLQKSFKCLSREIVYPLKFIKKIGQNYSWQLVYICESFLG